MLAFKATATKERVISTPAIKIPVKNCNNSEYTIKYSLQEKLFDPFKNPSPPNEFMKNLQNRMMVYNYLGINADNLNKE